MGKYNVEPLRSPAEIEEMKEALFELGGERDRFLFTFGINTGLRVSDIVKFKVRDVRGKPMPISSNKKPTRPDVCIFWLSSQR